MASMYIYTLSQNSFNTVVLKMSNTVVIVNIVSYNVHVSRLQQVSMSMTI